MSAYEQVYVDGEPPDVPASQLAPPPPPVVPPPLPGSKMAAPGSRTKDVIGEDGEQTGGGVNGSTQTPVKSGAGTVSSAQTPVTPKKKKGKESEKSKTKKKKKKGGTGKKGGGGKKGAKGRKKPSTKQNACFSVGLWLGPVVIFIGLVGMVGAFFGYLAMQ